jgi:alpha,alpha-trehalose phosphorylase
MTWRMPRSTTRLPQSRSVSRPCWPSKATSSTAIGRSPTSGSMATTRCSRGSASTCSASCRRRAATAGRASPRKGLSGEGYEGHYFWDTEIFALPFFIYTHPEIARSLLEFRCRTLDKAREPGPRAWPPGRALSVAHDRRRGDFAVLPRRDGPVPHRRRHRVRAGEVRFRDGRSHAAARGRGRAGVRDGAVLARPRRVRRRTGRRVLHQRGHGPGRVHGPGEQQLLHEPDGAVEPRVRGSVARDLASTDPASTAGSPRPIGSPPAEVAEWARGRGTDAPPVPRGLGIHAQDDLFLTRAVWDFAGTPPENYPLLLHYHPLNVYRFQVLKQPDVVLAQVLLPDRFTMAEKKRNFDYYDRIDHWRFVACAVHPERGCGRARLHRAGLTRTSSGRPGWTSTMSAATQWPESTPPRWPARGCHSSTASRGCGTVSLG